PGALSSSRIEPPWRRATAATRLSPKPLPGRERLFSRRTKRCSARSRSAGATPGPRSATLIPIASPTSAMDKTILRRAALPGSVGVVVYRIFDGVVDEVGDRLADELAVDDQAQAFFDGSLKLQSDFLGDGLVELGDVGDDRCRIGRPHAFRHRPRLQARDEQQ